MGVIGSGEVYRFSAIEYDIVLPSDGSEKLLVHVTPFFGDTRGTPCLPTLPGNISEGGSE